MDTDDKNFKNTKSENLSAVRNSFFEGDEKAYQEIYELKKAIPEAELMLNYASSKCIDVDDEVIKTLVACLHESNPDQWSVEREVDFWLAFRKLAKSLQPVDVGSIKSIHPNFSQKPSLLMRILSGKARLTAAQAASVSYKFFGIFMLVLVMILQIYSLIGSSLLTRTVSTARTYDSLEMIAVAFQDTATANMNDNPQIKNTKRELENKRLQMEASFSLLYRWHQTWKIFIFPWTVFDKENLEDSVMSDKEASREKKKKFITLTIGVIFPIKVMNTYLLPLLWGCLGACAYVLRKLAFEIQQMSFNREDNINYNLRIQLGALSGLVIGWFLMPNTDSINTSSNISIYSLSPLALSFLSGYSIELLFSAMDRLISTFTAPPANQ